MKKKLTINGTTYAIEEVTAIASISNGNEEERQAALLVSNTRSGERFDFVVFGWDMPETEEDFGEMSADSDAWESDTEVLESIKRK